MNIPVINMKNLKRLNKRKIPKVLPAAAALFLMMILTACAGSSPEETGCTVVSTIFPGYDIARQIASDKAEVIQLLPFGAESHTYEPTPRDMMLIRDCDVFIYAGGESDTWIEEILSEEGNPDRVVVSMMDCVSVLDEEEKEGMHEGGILSGLFEEEEEAEADEHTWTSPANAIKITQSVCDALCSVSPANAGIFRQNCDNYTARLSRLDERYREELAKCPNNLIVVADRFPFRYLCEEYGLDYRAAYPGCADNAEVTADSMIVLCDTVRDNGIPVVFSIEFSGGKIADAICEATGAKRATLHSCHNVSDDSETYMDIMEQNLDNLVEALR